MDKQLAVHLKLPHLACFAALAVGAITGCGSSRQDAGRTMFRVLTINVQHGDSADSRIDSRRIADVIKEIKPDLVALQGIRRSVVQSETFDILTTLSDLTGMTYAFGEIRAENGQRHGNGFLTNHPILEERNTLYPAGTSGKENGLLQLLLEVRGSEVRVLNTHLADDQVSGSDLRGQAVELKNLVRLNLRPPILVLGSSGRSSGSDAIASLKEILDDGWERAGTGQGFTFPAENPVERADFVFFSPGRPGFRAVLARVLEAPSPAHLPLMVEFELVAN